MPFDVGGITMSSPVGGPLAVANGATVWMRATAGGIVTRPQTPYMRGQLTGKGIYNPSGTTNGGVLLVTADVNFGSCWNNATGNFTCPVAGRYMTTFIAIANTQAGYIHIQRNGADEAMGHWNHMGTWENVSLSAIVNCAAGDTLRWLMNGLTPGTNGVYGDGGHGMFSIALMA